jgi:hypothetical protein
MKHNNRHWIASWMFVPAILAVPALVSGLSIWFQWGPDWFALSIAVTGAVLALVLDCRRALRWAFLGAGLGVATCPLLLLLDKPAWTLFAWWIAGMALIPALLVPLLWSPAPSPSVRRSSRKPTPAESEAALERLAALSQRVSHD